LKLHEIKDQNERIVDGDTASEFKGDHFVTFYSPTIQEGNTSDSYHPLSNTIQPIDENDNLINPTSNITKAKPL